MALHGQNIYFYWVKGEATGTTHYGTSTDGAELSDSAAAILTLKGLAQEGVEMSDSPVAVSALLASISDGIDLSEVVSGVTILPVVSEDGVVFTDANSISLMVSGDVEDTVVLSEGLDNIATYRGESIDGVDLAEAFVTTALLLATASEQTDISDSPAPVATLRESLSDGVLFRNYNSIEVGADNFNRADETLYDSANWSKVIGSYDIVIYNNSCRTTVNTTIAYAVWEGTQPAQDLYVEATVYCDTTTPVCGLLLYQDSANYIRMRYESSYLRLTFVSSTGGGFVASYPTLDWGSGSRFRIERSGATVRILVDNVVKLTRTQVQIGTKTFKGGIICQWFDGSTNHRIDDFTIGTLDIIGDHLIYDVFPAWTFRNLLAADGILLNPAASTPGGYTTIASDDFNRSNENLTASANWIAHPGATNGLTITSNHVHGLSSGLVINANLWDGTLPGESEYHAISMKFSASGSFNYMFMYLRYTDDSNNYQAWITTETINIYAYKGGVAYADNLENITLSVNDVIKFEVFQGSLNCYVNGILKNTTPIGTTPLTGGRPGIGAMSTDVYLDDFLLESADPSPAIEAVPAMTLRPSAVDGLVGSDSTTKLAQLVSTALDNVEFSEAVTRLATILANSSDQIDLAEATNIALLLMVSASDQVDFSEADVARMIARSTATDQADFSETVTRIATMLTTASDQAEFSETVTKLVTMLASVSDQAEFSEYFPPSNRPIMFLTSFAISSIAFVRSGVILGGVEEVKFTDNFNRSNEDLDTSAYWIGGSGNLQVISNECGAGQAGENTAYVSPLSLNFQWYPRDYWVTWKVAALGSTGNAGVWVRQDEGYQVWAYVDTTGAFKFEVMEAYSTVDTLTASQTVSVGDIIRVNVNGYNVSGFINGQKVLSTTFARNWDSFHNWVVINDTTARIDDFNFGLINEAKARMDWHDSLQEDLIVGGGEDVAYGYDDFNRGNEALSTSADWGIAVDPFPEYASVYDQLIVSNQIIGGNAGAGTGSFNRWLGSTPSLAGNFYVQITLASPNSNVYIWQFVDEDNYTYIYINYPGSQIGSLNLVGGNPDIFSFISYSPQAGDVLRMEIRNSDLIVLVNGSQLARHTLATRHTTGTIYIGQGSNVTALDNFEVGAIEEAVRTATYAGTVSDGIDWSDSGSNIASLFATSLDGMELSEVVAVIQTIIATSEDGITWSDVVTGIVAGALEGAAAEGLEMSETLLARLDMLGTALDGVELSDVVTALGVRPVSPVSGAEFSEAVAVTAVLVAAGQEGIELSEIVSVLATLIGINTDGMEFSETASAIATVLASAADGVEVADTTDGNITGGAVIPATSEDGVVMSDSALVIALLTASIADGIVYSDNSTRVATLLSSATDSLITSEQVVTVMTILSVAVDGIIGADTAGVTKTTFGTVSDGFDVADIPDILATFAALAEDGFDSGDTSSVTATYNVSCSDGIQYADAISTIMTFAGLVSDGLTFIDSALHVTASGELRVTFRARKSAVSFTVKAPEIWFKHKKSNITYH